MRDNRAFIGETDLGMQKRAAHPRIGPGTLTHGTPINASSGYLASKRAPFSQLLSGLSGPGEGLDWIALKVCAAIPVQNERHGRGPLDGRSGALSKEEQGG